MQDDDDEVENGKKAEIAGVPLKSESSQEAERDQQNDESEDPKSFDRGRAKGIWWTSRWKARKKLIMTLWHQLPHMMRYEILTP